MKGKRIQLPVTNEELREMIQQGASVASLAEKFGCASSVINRRLVEKTRYEKIDIEKATGLEIITLTDAMQITGLSRFLLTKLAKDGDIKYKKVGNRFMFQLKEVYKIIGIDIDKSVNVKYTEMDILKENQEKSESIEQYVQNLGIEMQKLKKSVMNENKETYDREVINALKVINESQNKMNATILEISKNQNKMSTDLENINSEIDRLNTKYNSLESIPIKRKPDGLAKFGGK
jgi:hypothetical protein